MNHFTTTLKEALKIFKGIKYTEVIPTKNKALIKRFEGIEDPERWYKVNDDKEYNALMMVFGKYVSSKTGTLKTLDLDLNKKVDNISYPEYICVIVKENEFDDVDCEKISSISELTDESFEIFSLSKIEREQNTYEQAYDILRKLKHVDGYPPYDGDYTNADNSQRWYRVKNEKEYNSLMLLLGGYKNEYDEVEQEYFNLSRNPDTNVSFPEWVCVTSENRPTEDIDNYKIEEMIEYFDVISFHFTTLTECKEAFNKMLDALK